MPAAFCSPLLAMAPPLSLAGHIVAAVVGLYAGALLVRGPHQHRPGRTVRGLLIATCGVGISYALGEPLGIIPFLAGGIGGAVMFGRPVPRTARQAGRAASLAVICLFAGPLLGLALFGLILLTDEISPLDRTYYLTVLLVIGTIAGALAAGLVAAVGRNSDDAPPV